MIPKNHLKNYLEFLPAIAVSILLFFYLTNGKILNFNYSSWLNGSDSSQFYLGWLFFKNGDIFKEILGANPAYGYETGASIVYTDSIPLLAIFFKLFKNHLPENFQYFGIWLLICFILQAITSQILLKRFIKNPVWQFFGSLFFIFSPILIFRIFMCEHYSLAAHFLILISFIFYLSDKFKLWRWNLLFVITLGIHFYIFVMIFFIFLADLLQRILAQKMSIVISINFLLENMLFAIFYTSFSMWQYGYFVIGVENSAAELFGYVNLNLLSIFDSNTVWSKFFTDLPEITYGYEGFAFLGFSVFLMLFIILLEKYFIKSHKAKIAKSELNYQNILPLALVLILLTLIALTNHIFLASTELFVIAIPKKLEVILAIIRATGRMFWPCYYIILLYAILKIIKLAEQYKFSPKKITLILAFFACLQIFDISGGLEKSRQNMFAHYSNQTLEEKLKSDFWQNIKNKYQKIIFLPVENCPPNYGAIAYFAGMNNIRINTAYFARFDFNSALLANKAHEFNVKQGIFEDNALYIFKDQKLFKTVKNKARSSDFVREIDGYKILAPKFKAAQSESNLVEETVPESDL